MQRNNFRKILKSCCAILLAVMMLITVLALGATAASGGSGTKKDPYLLKTAKDVDNIRNDLGAHYKLAANIDMKSFGVFEPIGCFEPFTGTLTCDLGSNGLPKYAITNLKVDNQIGAVFGYEFASANYAGYGEKGVHYYASLFGKTNGAVIENIFLLNADITNTVVGQHAGVGGYFDGGPQTIIRDQVDDQGAGALVTFAYGTTISGCGMTGKVTSRANCTAGLVGRLLEGSSMTNCFADVTITANGFWTNGGLVGQVSDSTVDGCMSRGTAYAAGNKPYVKLGIRNAGSAISGLAGNINKTSVISNSYSELVFKKDKNGHLVAQDAFCFSENNEGTIENCYATGTIEGNGGVTASKSTSNNNWVLNTSGVKQATFDFKAGSKSDIIKAFKGLEGWDTSGELPKLTALIYITKGGELEGDKGGTTADTADKNTASKEETTSKNEEATSQTTSTSEEATTSTPEDNSGDTNATESTTSDTENNESEETVLVGAADENIPAVYIVLFASIAAITVAITAFSSVLLLKTYKRQTALDTSLEEDEEEE